MPYLVPIHIVSLDRLFHIFTKQSMRSGIAPIAIRREPRIVLVRYKPGHEKPRGFCANPSRLHIRGMLERYCDTA